MIVAIYPDMFEISLRSTRPQVWFETEPVLPRRAPLVAIAIALLALWSVFATPAFARQVSLEEAVAFAIANNPDYAAASRELLYVHGELQRANYISQFNPEALAGGDYRRSSEQWDSEDWRVDLSQQFEIFGQPGLRRRSAGYAVSRAAANFANQKRLLIAAVKLTFYETIRTRLDANLFKELAALDGKLNDAAQARLRVGEIGQIDANLARVRYGQSSRALLEARDRYRVERLSLGRLLGGAAGAQPEPAGGLQVEPLVVDAENLLAMAKDNRPDYRAAKLEIARLETETKLNRRLALPNPTVGAFMGREVVAERFYGVMLGVPLPFFNRRQAETTQIDARLLQARDHMRALDLDIAREVAAGWDRYETALAVTEVDRKDIVTPARESFDLLEAAFVAGKLDLLSLSVAERQAFEARIADVSAWFNLAASEVTLDLAVGGIQ